MSDQKPTSVTVLVTWVLAALIVAFCIGYDLGNGETDLPDLGFAAVFAAAFGVLVAVIAFNEGLRKR